MRLTKLLCSDFQSYRLSPKRIGEASGQTASPEPPQDPGRGGAELPGPLGKGCALGPRLRGMSLNCVTHSSEGPERRWQRWAHATETTLPTTWDRCRKAILLNNPGLSLGRGRGGLTGGRETMGLGGGAPPGLSRGNQAACNLVRRPRASNYKDFMKKASGCVCRGRGGSSVSGCTGSGAFNQGSDSVKAKTSKWQQSSPAQEAARPARDSPSRGPHNGHLLETPGGLKHHRSWRGRRWGETASGVSNKAPRLRQKPRHWPQSVRQKQSLALLLWHLQLGRATGMRPALGTKVLEPEEPGPVLTQLPLAGTHGLHHPDGQGRLQHGDRHVCKAEGPFKGARG